MPDQAQILHEQATKRFEEHVKHFEQLDDVLKEFTHLYRFTLEKNQWHRPCRVLRKKGNPEYVIEVAQEGEWEKVLYREDLPHSVTVIAHVVDEKQEFVYRLKEEVAYFVHFSTIQNNLRQYLETAMAQIQKWTADVIVRDGAQSRHPLAHYREHGGINIQSVE